MAYTKKKELTQLKQNNGRNIVVNATALGSTGGLTVLEQFINEIPENNDYYTIFVAPGIKFNHNRGNIKIVPKNVKQGFIRFIWDFIGAALWLRKNNISPSVSLSLQNTNFNTGFKIPNFIYYHNAIPFYNKSWKLHRKEERTLWFYKNLYPAFVKFSLNKRTSIFVQSAVIRQNFADQFSFPEEKVFVIKPILKFPEITGASHYILNKENLNLIYPATPFVYKNHKTILVAIDQLDTYLKSNITLYLTCKKEELAAYIDIAEFKFSIEFVGKISKEQLFELYRKVDVMLYPSYIETIGLPLIEASFTGLEILVADLPYSREVLEEYEGATFIHPDKPLLWTYGISQVFNRKGKRYSPPDQQPVSTWGKLFEILDCSE